MIGARALLLLTVALGVAGRASAQEQPPPAPAEGHDHVDVEGTLLTPTTDTTGTAWLPRATPMYGLHREWGGWDVRLDGALFLQLLYEPGDRHRTGGFATHQVGSVNWAMATARRRAGAGRVGLRAMLSAEPLTLPGCGALSFLATGEVCDGDTIHDRQQPHDLVMELAVEYERPLRGSWRWQAYGGLAGEPAFGPASFHHRPSAAGNPIAPVTHHWIEATRPFGVVTAGVHNRRWKAEASAFSGRAADEARSDLDLGALDSVSGRVSYLPTDRVALQVSATRMREARFAFERQPEARATKISASATYHKPLGARGIWASTLAYGATHAREQVPGGILDATSSAAMAETTVIVDGRHSLFGRAEAAGMPAHHLHAHEHAQSIVPVGKLEIGYARLLGPRLGLVPGIGGTASVSLLPSALAPRYGGGAAPGFSVFVSLRPERHRM